MIGSRISPPTFRLGPDATLDDLNRFARETIRPHSHIHGVRGKDGIVTLHVGVKPSGFARISSLMNWRRTSTSAAVVQMLERSFAARTGSLHGLSPQDARRVAQLAGDLHQLQHATRRSLDGSQIDALITAYHGIVAQLPASSGDVDLSQVPDRVTLCRDIGSAFADLRAGERTQKETKTRVADVLEGCMREIAPGEQAKLSLVCSSGRTLCDEIAKAIGADTLSADGIDAGYILQAAYRSATDRLFPGNKVLHAQTSTVMWESPEGGTRTMDVPNVMIAGVEYRAASHAGSGSFGNVFLMQPADPQSNARPIALKVSSGDVDDTDTACEDLAREVAAHGKAEGEGSRNILHLAAALHLSGGRTAIALEAAPHGDALDLGRTINEAVKAGTLTAEEARILKLTSIRDLLQGVSHMQSNGVLHRDLKSPNVLLGADGHLKIMDFGTSLEATSYAVEARVVENPTWQAPEVLGKVGSLRKMNKSVFKARLTGYSRPPVAYAVARILPDADKTIQTIIGRNMAEAASAQKAQQMRARSEVDGKSDVWAAGMIAADIMRGEPFGGDTPFMSRIEDQLVAFAAKPGGVALAARVNGRLPANALMEATGDHAVDSFLNKLLSADPAARPSAFIAQADSLLHGPGIGSSQATDLLIALKTGTPDQIKQARAALAAVVSALQPQQFSGKGDQPDFGAMTRSTVMPR